MSVSGALSSDSLLNMVQVPFVGRVERLRLLGALVAASGFLTVLIVSLRRRYPRGPAGRLALVLTIAAGGPLTLVALSAAGGHAFWGHLMLARYAAACGPFVLVMLAAAVDVLPRPAAGVLVGGAIVVSIAGILASHRRTGFFFDARRVVAYVEAGHQPGDAVIAPPAPVEAVPLLHYGLGTLRPLWVGSPSASALIRAHFRRIWLISELPSGSPNATQRVLSYTRAILAQNGYRPLSLRVFPSTSPTAAILAAPVP